MLITRPRQFSYFPVVKQNCEIGQILLGFVLEKPPFNEIVLSKLEATFFIKEYQRELLELKHVRKQQKKHLRMPNNSTEDATLEFSIQLALIKAEREEILRKTQLVREEINRVSSENRNVKHQLASFRTKCKKHQSQEVPRSPYSVNRKILSQDVSGALTDNLYTEKEEISKRTSELQREWALFNREKEKFRDEQEAFKREFSGIV